MGNLKSIKKILSLTWRVIKIISFSSWVIFASILGIAILLALYLSLSCACSKISYNKFIRKIPFDHVGWQASDRRTNRENYTRCRMYKDLIKNHLHIGMPYKEVIKLLGEPLSVVYYTNPETKRLEYDVGDCTHVCLSLITDVRGYLLFLSFDRNSKLINFGHGDDYNNMYKKNRMTFLNNFKSLFTCYYSNKCVRYITLSDAKRDNCGESGPICRNDEDCKRYIKYSECPVTKEEECKKTEVESKWGYKLW